MRDLRSFRNRLEHRTTAWSAFSVLAAAFLYLRPSPFLHALAISLAAWAGLGILASLLSELHSLRRTRALSDQADPLRSAGESRAVNRPLELALALGAAGSAAGLSLALRAAAPEWRGAGWGTLGQGAFVLRGSEHEPFLLDGQEGAVGFPSSILEQVVRSGWHARRGAGSLRLPVLIVQGAEDAVVHPESTRRLVQRFPVPPRYVEVPGEHALTRPSGQSWEIVRRETLSFAGALQKDCTERNMEPC